MKLTEAEQAEIAANRKRYEALKAAGQDEAPRALPPATPRDGAPVAEVPLFIERPFRPDGIGRRGLVVAKHCGS